MTSVIKTCTPFDGGKFWLVYKHINFDGINFTTARRKGPISFRKMPRHCSAGGCKSRDNRDTRNAGITFHKLPKGAPRRNLWISNSHRADSWDPQTDFVYFCSKHFTPQSFELTGCSGIRRLKEDAYPTIFDLSLGVKGKRATTHQKQDVSRKKSCSWAQDTETIQDHTMEKASTQSSAAATEDSNETAASFQDSSCMTRLSQQEHVPSPESRPCSPSHYMRRLPPPPGFYLSNEHSYAQLCPLLWRKRYDQVVACLEKALQQLHAAKRRESRLRSTVLRLRDKGLKLPVPLSQQGGKDRTGCKLGGRPRRHRATCDPQEEEPEPPSLEDRCSDSMEVDNCFLSKSSNWSKEVKRYCFYCGRGQVQIVWEAECRGSETWTDVLPTHQEDSLQRSSETIRFSLVGPEGPPGAISENSVTDGAAHQVQIQNLDLQQWAALPLSGTHEQGETGRSGQEQQQVVWTEDSKVDQFILVPVHTKKGLETFRVAEPVPDESQTQLDLNVHVQRMTEDSGSLPRYETAGADENEHCVVAAPPVEVREDVREKLKEHLEGFHLQLSTEFKS